MKYRDMTPEQKEVHKANVRKYIAKDKDGYNARMRKFLAEDLNSQGKRKQTIRSLSGYILSKCHAKLPGYQIHHCFSYEDPSKFIYIPKSLHLEIHQLLRDQKIPADSDHWMAIRDLVNSYEEYMYIRC